MIRTFNKANCSTKKTSLGKLSVLTLLATIACSSALPAGGNDAQPVTVNDAREQRGVQEEGRRSAQRREAASCGREPSATVYQRLGSRETRSGFENCAKTVASGLNRAQSMYLAETEQNFPLGFGLERAVSKQCLASDQRLPFTFRQAGICSNIAMAMLVLQCIREQTKSHCFLPDLVRSYYVSSVNEEWWSLEGDALPPGVTTNRHGQRISKTYRSILEFLDYLADRVEPGPYDPKRIEEIEPKRLAPYLSLSPVKFADVDWPGPVVATRARIERELKAREGPVFTALTQLGWMYGRTAPHMSHLQFLPSQTGVWVDLPETYRLLFEKDNGIYRLTELRQLMHSDL